MQTSLVFVVVVVVVVVVLFCFVLFCFPIDRAALLLSMYHETTCAISVLLQFYVFPRAICGRVDGYDRQSTSQCSH